jgi:O-antigen/teichoic acid export membrane protein
MQGARGALLGNYAALAVALASQLVLLPLLLTRLGPVDAGLFIVLWSAVNFAGAAIGWLSGGGTVMMTQAAAAGNEAGVAQVYWRFARGMAGCGAAAWVALALWGAGVGTWWMRDVTPANVAQIRIAVHGAGLYMLALDLHQADLALLTARLRQSAVAGFRVALQLLMFAMGAAGVVWGRGVGAMFVGYAIAAVLVCIIAHVVVRRTAWPVVMPARNDSSAIYSGALGRFAGYSIVFSVLQYADTLILSLAAGPAAVLLMTFLQRLPDGAALVIGRASETLGPYYSAMAAGDEAEQLRQTYLTVSRVIWRVAAVSAAGFAVFGRDVVDWWSRGHLALPPAWYFAGSGLVLLAAIVNRNSGLLAYYAGQPGLATRLLLWELGLRAAVLLVLVWYAGALAPMFAALTAQFAVLLVAYRRVERDLLRVHMSTLLATCLRPAIASGAPALAMMMSLRALTTSAIDQRGIALGLAGLCALLVLVFQERHLGRQLFRRRRA